MTRTAPEEANPLAYWDDQDVTNTKFPRTYMSREFAGKVFVRRVDAEQNKLDSRTLPKILPLRTDVNAVKSVQHVDDLYGFRGSSRNVYY